MSQKHLITQFKEFSGGTPKEMSRIYRYKQVLYNLDPTRPVDLSQVAYQARYYDQSYFRKFLESRTLRNNLIGLARGGKYEAPSVCDRLE